MFLPRLLGSPLIFENENFLAVDKRAGYLSVPSRQGEIDPRPCEGIEWKEKLRHRLFPVHRLDEEVSGVLLFAKTEDAHRAAGLWFEQRKVHKTYEALTTRTAEQYPSDKLTWKSRLLRGKKRAYEKEFGKPAVTEAWFLGDGFWKKSWAWRLSPLTGRSHQLRFEMYKRRHPIWGDELYGSPERTRGGILLRAVSLDFGDLSPKERLGLPDQLRVDSLHAWAQRQYT